MLTRRGRRVAASDRTARVEAVGSTAVSRRSSASHPSNVLENRLRGVEVAGPDYDVAAILLMAAVQLQTAP
jgi:hypothetical protein